MQLDMFVFLLNTRAGSRFSYSPLMVLEQVMSHTLGLFEIICVVTAGPLLSAIIQIFHEKHMRSNGCTSHNLVYFCISVFNFFGFEGGFLPVCPRLTCVSVSSSD